MFSTPGSVVAQVRGGTLRGLAATSAKRMSVLPGLPAVSETLPGYDAVSWAGIGAPAHTPAPVVEKINAAVNAALTEPKLRSQLADFGAEVMTGSPGDFGKFIAADIEKWRKVIKFAGIPTMK
jgi:tripartite-type tricarboxylate transporter receptor subunit TctC